MSDAEIENSKCLLVTPHYLPMYGGALTVYDALAREFAGGIEILTATTDYTTGKEVGGWRDFDEQSAYPIHRVPALRGPLRANDGILKYSISKFFRNRAFEQSVLNAVVDQLKKTEADILCIGALETLGWLAKAVKVRTKVKVVTYVHGEEVSQTAYSSIADRRRKLSLVSSDAVIAVSQFTAEVIRTKYGVSNQKIKLLKNGVDLEKFDLKGRILGREALGLPNKPYVLSVGRLVERKGFDRLIEAWSLVVKKEPDAQLIIGGEGPLTDTLVRRIEALGLTGHVSMIGWIEDDALPSIYAHAQLFAMPNRTLDDGDTEGFGLVLLEAAAMGTASIAGNAGGTPAALIDGQTGVLVDGEYPEQIADKILGMLNNPNLSKEMGAAAHEFANSQGWPDKARELRKIFNAVRNES